MGDLPCPFCGGTQIVFYDTKDWDAEVGVFVGCCLECKAEGPQQPTEVKAKLAWNTLDNRNQTKESDG